ncbi:MAG: DinB family protein [Saprospiraceae bacterium]
MQNKIVSRYERYSGEVNTLLETLSAYTNEQVNKQPGAGWSAIQTIHHLILSEELSFQYVQKKLGFDPKLEKAGLKHEWNRFLLFFYLNVPIKFKAPLMVGDTSLPEYVSLDDTKIRWKKIQSNWHQFLSSMPNELKDKAVYRHPIAGRMSWTGMLVFFSTHFKRHKKQILAALQP